MLTKQLEKSIGDYEILRELGTGPLGKVFAVRHRFLQKPYLLHLLPSPEADANEYMQQFTTQVARIATLDHPHILKLVGASEANGQCFFVSENPLSAQMEATDLASEISKGRVFSEEEVYSMAKQIVSALTHAHQKSFEDEPLAHGQLELGSVHLEETDGELSIRISDFGVTRITGIEPAICGMYASWWKEMASEKSLRTVVFSFENRYHFIAPEFRNKDERSREGDVRGDIYSFGVLVYFLLTNKFPIGAFPMPSVVCEGLTKNWDQLVRQCLDLDSQKRPSTADEALRLVNTLAKEDRKQPKLKPQVLSRPKYEAEPSAVFQTDKTVAIYKPAKTAIEKIEPLMTEMRVVEGGTFLRGSNNGARDEMPRHAIHLGSFAIDMHPVTNEQFILFLRVMGGEKDANNNDMIRLRDSRIRKVGGKLSIESGYAKHPVVGVSWYGAMAYSKWVGKRLPTEAEWEIAACGGLEGAHFPSGDSMERSQANFFNADTTPVASYPSNGFDLFDMSGNVYEWCMDWYGYHFYETSIQEPDNPTGPPQGVYRVLRGGCWKSLKEDMRCSHRHRNNPGIMNGTYGFRCAADVT